MEAVTPCDLVVTGPGSSAWGGPGHSISFHGHCAPLRTDCEVLGVGTVGKEGKRNSEIPFEEPETP